MLKSRGRTVDVSCNGRRRNDLKSNVMKGEKKTLFYGFEQERNKLPKEVVAVEKEKQNAKLRHNEYYNMQNAYDKLYQESAKGKKHKNLMSLITSDANILLAYRNIKSNTGSRTSGIDGKTIDAIADMEEDELVSEIKRLLVKYKPFPVKRVEIPKPNGKTRPLGIPTIKDRLIQQCILQVLEPICEAKFYPQSYGFRPGRSAENAVANVYKRIQLQKLHYVVDVDIKSFFDNVDHDKLIRQMWSLGIRDKKLICIIKAMLKAEIIMPDGTKVKPTKGTPQGGILSPLLANIVLNELDWWVVSNWQNVKTKREYTKTIQANGEITEHHKYEQLKKTTTLKEMWITRYADDFKIFCRTEEDAIKTLHAVKDWLEKRLHLQVSPEKTGITNLETNNTEFLGLIIGTKCEHGKHVVQSHVNPKAIRRIYNSLKEQIRIMQRPTRNSDMIKAINRYNSIVIGVHNYYEMATLVSQDMGWIAKQINTVQYNRLRGKISKNGIINNKYLESRYGKSEQMRFVEGVPIVPIGYVQHKSPMAKNYKANAYTEEGRKYIHKQLSMDKETLKWILEHPIQSRSTEYNDNRVSKYVAQKGKCSVTGKILDVKSMHLHHIIPRKNGGTDKYNNLTLVDGEIHKLIHATEEETIKALVELISTTEQIKKLNKLRAQAGTQEIKIECFSIQ